MNERNVPRTVPLALVHHANQYLIADDYDNRQGISRIVEGYAAALRLHEKYGIPASVHLSGTLIEAIAWHCPWFLTLVKSLRAKGLLALIGGTYAENVMPLFSPAFNRRQLNEHLWLYGHHLDCPPSEVKVCWVPERVWDASLAPILTDRGLANGGYRVTLLDDRLLYPINGSYSESPRAKFDSFGPYGLLTPSSNGRRPWLEDEFRRGGAYRVCRIRGANGLGVVPISSNLRYWVPPRSPDDWRRLEQTVNALVQDGRGDTLLVYADDLEKTAGVGGWEAGALERYETFLQWVADQGKVAPILLANWLADRPLQRERALEAGTFFELAQGWQAGEDYRKWWDSAAWSPYRRYLADAQKAVSAAERAGADGRLLTLAWKHLLASGYETAWHDAALESYTPAPWSKAVASHARTSLTMAAAARWFAQSVRQPSTQLLDIDEDGEEEVILRSERLYVVITPLHGGRIVYLFASTPQGGAMLIGNPTDDWNFQQELNRYMDQPPNHPGALVDVGFVYDCYQVCGAGETGACVEMMNLQPGSGMLGTRKSVILAPDAPALVVCYRLPDGRSNLAVEACLSPDYYTLLREGRRSLSPCKGGTWSGFRQGDAAVWVGLARDEETTWAQPARVEVGHGLNVRVQAQCTHFHLLVGCGPADDERCQQLIAWGRNALDD